MINYQNIQDSINFYEKHKFQRIESPWTVSKYVDDLTKPKEKISFQLKHNNKCLVASGEQSFLYLYLKGFLPKGKFQTTTPCFRYEEFDDLHSKYFIKNELIQTEDVSEDSLTDIINVALTFYQKYFKQTLKIVPTEIGFDIQIHNDELGSYGIREVDFLKWIYGTGCAEPRLSTLINKHNGLP